MEQFTIVKRGYDPEEVDSYIITLEQVIKSYKDKDNAIKNAIISAQVAADNMIRNAKLQADEYKAQIGRSLIHVRQEVDRQRVRIQAFQDVYSNLMRKYLTATPEGDMTDLYGRLDDVEMTLNILLNDGDLSVNDSPFESRPANPLSPEDMARAASLERKQQSHPPTLEPPTEDY